MKEIWKNNKQRKKKRTGDAIKIAEIANELRSTKGLKQYSERTVRAMLNGERTMNEYVREAKNKYYEAIMNLKNITV